MRLIGIDPGIRECSFTVLDDTQGWPEPIHWGGWHNNDKGTHTARSLAIALGLRAVCHSWRVNAWATEEFYSPHGKMAATLGRANYQRGAFDAILLLALGHMPHCKIHPGHLKIMATGKGNAPKIRGPKMKASDVTVIEGLERKYTGPVLDRMKNTTTDGQWNHMIESWGIGEIAYWLMNDRFEGEDLDDHIMRALKKNKGAWEPPLFLTPAPMPPLITDPE